MKKLVGLELLAALAVAGCNLDLDALPPSQNDLAIGHLASPDLALNDLATSAIRSAMDSSAPNDLATCANGACEGAQPDDVMLYLQFEGQNGSTKFTDSSKYKRVVSSKGGAEISLAESAPVAGSKASLYANGGHVEVANSDDFVFPGAFSIEAWVYHVAHCYDALFTSVSEADGVSTEYGLYITLKDAGGIPDDHLSFYLGVRGVGRVDLYSTSTIALNAWTKVRLSRDADFVWHIALNDVEDPIRMLEVNASFDPTITLGNSHLVLGAGGDALGNTLLGYLDELKVTKD